MKTTKDQAKQEVDVYGSLLQERAVISTIETEQVRGQIRYSFTVNDVRYPFTMECDGIKELALVLTAMWSSYMCARHALGIDVSDSM